MVNKDTIYKWDKRENNVFSRIKEIVAESPALYNPDLNKYFLLYTFAFNTSLVIVLTQKDELNNERPIPFMSASLQGPQLNYLAMKK